jgi:predicted DNA-binding WGR domain protein
MAIKEHVKEFAGYRVVDYKPEVGIAVPENEKVEAPAPSPGARRREFQFIEGSARKFWAIQLEGKAFEVTFGRIGTAGQTQRKEFKTAGEALKAHDKLIAEKVGKGYAEIGSAAGPARKPAAQELIPAAYWVGMSYWKFHRKDVEFADKLAAFLAEPGLGALQALVIGCWSYEGGDSSSVVEALVAARDKLPSLKALFLGDITCEEQEISWIVQSDVTALFDAYPELEHFRARGGQGLGLGPLKHQHLKSLAFEASNLPAEVVRAVGRSDLPALEHLELWLGTEQYGADTTVADLKGIFAGKGLPALRYLGLRNSEITDAIARAFAKAPIVTRLRVLDFSLGTLSDKGAEALLAVPGLANLEELDIHHHFVSPASVRRLADLGITVNASDWEVEEEDEEVDEDALSSLRYVAHAE